MPKDGNKTAIGLGIAGLIVGGIYLATRAGTLKKPCGYCGIPLVIKYKVLPGVGPFPITSYFACPICDKTKTRQEVFSVFIFPAI